MELILAIIAAGPIGYFARSRRQGVGVYLLLWAIVFPIQTIVVHAENADDISVIYVVFNALILALGVGLNAAGARLRQRSRARAVLARPG